ncbi:hypothetical protein M0N77_11245 [Psychrobacter sp. AH5]|uniref:hypothetical protein n=1 Tax=Psychrobacter sp. AH5 TaxID=2937433 RepID=UPI003340B7FD
MTKSTQQLFDISQPEAWLNTYLLEDESSDNERINSYRYHLPLGQLNVLKINAILASSDSNTDIEATRLAAIKFSLRWQKKLIEQHSNKQASVYVLALNIRLLVNSENLTNTKSNDLPLQHSFGAQYAIDHLASSNDKNADKSSSILSVFSWQDWQSVLATVLTPGELWRLLQYHKAALQQSFISGQAGFDSEQQLVNKFMNSADLYTQAIRIDNALIKYAIQDEPNRSLVTMSLAQKHGAVETESYHQQMQQAAMLWAQISGQMLLESQSTAQLSLWQRQLLDESLFSRHQLIHTLYQHPSRPSEEQQTGYVIHQHSYESLGRHYVLIFYGQQRQGKHSRMAIAPNLETIAKDVATRLPIAELHHIIVLGIEFIVEGSETFIDIDLFIQPVTAMSEKERQLTRQLQRLNQQNNGKLKDNNSVKKQQSKSRKTDLPSVQLSLTIAANKSES